MITIRPDSTDTCSAPRAASRTRRWAAGLMLAGATLGCVWLDTHLKSSSDAGFLPDSAVWRVEAADLPAAWAQWRTQDAWTAMRQASPALHNNLPLFIRRMTGIRPTPGRLKLWLGTRVLVGGDEHGWCLSVRPGIAMHVAAWFRGPLSAEADELVSTKFTSAWRDGFLLLASSPEYLKDVLAAGKLIPRDELKSDEVRLSWQGKSAGSLLLRAAPELPVAFTFAGQAPESAALHFAVAWPEAMLSLNIRPDSPVSNLAHDLFERALSNANPDSTALIQAICSEWWRTYCPVPLDPESSEEWAAGIFAANWEADVPILEVAMARRDRGTSWTESMPTENWHEHRWNDIPGWLIPVPGDARVWAVASADGTDYLTSHEERMPSLLATAARVPEAGVAAVNWQWKPLTEFLSDLLLRAARDGLLPGLNERDMSLAWLPYVEAFGNWGELQFRARGAGDHIEGEGWLARGADTGQ